MGIEDFSHENLKVRECHYHWILFNWGDNKSDLSKPEEAKRVGVWNIEKPKSQS